MKKYYIFIITLILLFWNLVFYSTVEAAGSNPSSNVREAAKGATSSSLSPKAGTSGRASLQSAETNIYQSSLEEGRTIFFKQEAVAEDGDCGFTALKLDRGQAVSLLLIAKSRLDIRALVAPEIKAAFLEDSIPIPMRDDAAYTYLQDNFIRKQTALDEKVRALKETLPLGERENKDAQQLVEHLLIKNRGTEASDLQDRIEGVENLIKEYCMKEEIYEAFVRHYIGTTGWLAFNRAYGTSTLDALPNLQRMTVYIWQSDERDASRLNLIYRTLPYGDVLARGAGAEISSGQTVHLLYTNGGMHYDLLREVKERDATDVGHVVSSGSAAKASVLLGGGSGGGSAYRFPPPLPPASRSIGPAGGSGAGPAYEREIAARLSALAPVPLTSVAGGESSGGAVYAATAASASAGAGDASSPPSKLMGIEVETSVIKLRSPGEDKMGFMIGASPAWMIEEDTQDETFKTHAELGEFNRNMEFKTIGGHGRDSIIAMAADIERCVHLIYEHSKAKKLLINPIILKGFLGRELSIAPKKSSQDDFMVSSKSENPIIRPQITYQIPLEEIHRIFKRLRELNHENVKEFLDVLDPSIVLPERDPSLSGRLTANPLLKVMGYNLGKKHEIQRLFRERIAPIFSSLEENRLKGFIYLFLYYWYEIFNNKQGPHPEPGVKPWLAIMSRVPLSQIYDSLLQEEKDKFRDLMERIIVEIGGGYQIRNYRGYDKKPVVTDLNVRGWYFSIVDKKHRQTVKIKKLHGLSSPHKKVDLLSPPPELINRLDQQPYSMGSLNLKDSSGFPLIEVRGYSSIQIDGRELTIIDLNRFVAAEAAWFFGS